MKLIVLYGPPAAGKLTIARELVKHTGYKLLHNHQTFDLLEPVFGALHPQFSPLLNRLRLAIVTAAAEAGFEGLIVTHVYGPEEAEFMRSLEAAVTERSGETHFVRFAPRPDELERRVQHPGRHEFKKLKTVEELRGLMRDWDVTQEIPGVSSLTVDNTDLTPEEAAQLLIRELILPEQPAR